MALTKVKSSNVDDQVIGRRNMIYNGKMQVSQRNGTGNTAVGWSNADHYPADRWKLIGSPLGNWAFTIGNRTDLTLPPGFGNAVLLECTTADTSITQGEYIIFQHKFEGSDVQHLCYGTSSAKEITLSFYIYSTSTGTYLAELETGSYINGIKFTIDQANTWERKTITFTGNTAASIANNNGLGLSLGIWFAAGNTYQGGTFVSNTWRNSYANNTRAAGISNLASSTSNDLYITGVQLEVGDAATPFEHRSLAEELTLCQRYFLRLVQPHMSGIAVNSSTTSTNVGRIGTILPTTMRAIPSCSLTAGLNVYQGSNVGQTTGVLAQYNTVHAIEFDFSSNMTNDEAGRAAVTYQGGTAKINIDAEI